MRKAFQSTVSSLVEQDDRVVVLLGDIGVYGFSKSAEEYPDRVLNIGILEQATIGVAAGLSISGMIPIVHSIAPFVVERPFEQLKVDFGYQGLMGNIVSVGASFDYSALGATHHSPADVSLLLTIPGVQVCFPGTAREASEMLYRLYSNDSLTYFRLSEEGNNQDFSDASGEPQRIKRGGSITILALGPTLNAVLEATALLDNQDIEIVYLNNLDLDNLNQAVGLVSTNKLMVVEPFYEYTTSSVLLPLLSKEINTRFVGIPRRFIDKYGSRAEIQKHLGVDSQSLSQKFREFALA